MERTAIIFVALAAAVIGLYASMLGMAMLGSRSIYHLVAVGLISALAAALVSLSVSPRVAARVSRAWHWIVTIISGVIFVVGAWTFRQFVIN